MSATRRSQNTNQNEIIKISIGLSPENSGQWLVGSGEIKTAHCPLLTFSILPAIKFRQSSTFNEIQRPIQLLFNPRRRNLQALSHSLRRPSKRGVLESVELYGWRTFKCGVLVTVRHPSQT